MMTSFLMTTFFNEMEMDMSKAILASMNLVFVIVIWFSPHPQEVSKEAWHLLALFLGTIFSMISKVIPSGTACVIALSLSIVTKTLSLDEGLSGFSHPIVWLVVVAFFIAKGFTKTGLGNRIAYFFIYLMGRNSLCLGYGLILGDLLISPAIPSNTARAGGVMFPINKSIAKEFKSFPKTQSAKKIGEFLMLCSFHGNVVTSAMFLTAMAANPLLTQIAKMNGVHISWTDWALAACLPGLLSLILIPLVIYAFARPQIKETLQVRDFSIEKLKSMGPLTRQEKSLIGVFCFLLIGWIYPPFLGGASSTTVAFLGLALLLLLKVLSWDDIKGEKNAWDTLIWFAVLLTFVTFLDRFGLVPYFGSILSQMIHSVSAELASLILILSYFFIHYFFASTTSQVTVLYGLFLTLGIQLGIPARPFALLLGFVSSLCGGLTHYSMGHAPILFGEGFVNIRVWWKIGLLVGLCNLFIWIVFGSLWMKFIGFF